MGRYWSNESRSWNENTHKVNFNMNVNPIEAHSFTRDQNILNILMQLPVMGGFKITI